MGDVAGWTSAYPLAVLRAVEFTVVSDGLQHRAFCRWPGCTHPAEDLAHLHHRGRGGGPAANTYPNVVALCNRFGASHHDRLDGRRRIRWFDLVALFDSYASYREFESTGPLCTVCDRVAVTNKRLVESPNDSPRYLMGEYHAPMFVVEANAYPGQREAITALLKSEKQIQDLLNRWTPEHIGRLLMEGIQ